MNLQQQLGVRRCPSAPFTAPLRPAPRANAVRCFSNADGGGIEVSFSLPYRCKYGQRLCVIGASDNLGAWNVARAVPMEWTEGDVWIVDLKLPSDGAAALEYKYVVRSELDMEAVRWKEGGNFQLRLPAQGRLRVRDTWDESCREVEKIEVPPAPKAERAPVAERAPAAARAPAAVQEAPRRRRKKVDEDAELQASISRAADKAMHQLDAAVSRSLDLLGSTPDPAAPELLAADRLVAAAAKRATTMNRALDAAREAKLLPTGRAKNGANGGSRPGGSGQRRRRPAVANRDGAPVNGGEH